MAFNIIEYIIKNTTLKQKDIAKKLGVTTGQISKWKQGEYIARERKEELNKLAGLFGHNAEWAVLSKTKANSDAWFEHLVWCASNEGISIAEIEARSDLIFPNIFILFSRLGVSIPIKPPIVSVTEISDCELAAFDIVIARTLKSYCVLIHWSDKQFSHLVSDNEICEIVNQIQSKALNVALVNVGKTDEEILLSTGIKKDLLVELNQKTNNHVRELIRTLVRKMNAKRLPITADYFLYIEKSTEWLEIEMMNSDYGDEMTQFLTYAEKNLLELQKQNIHFLESLNKKIDTLLPPKVKKKLKDYPEILDTNAINKANHIKNY